LHIPAIENRLSIVAKYSYLCGVKNKRKSVWLGVGLAVGALVTIAAAGLGLALLGSTLVEWWVPALFAAVVAVATMPLTRSWLTRVLGGRLWAVCAHIALVGSLAFALFLGVNDWGATGCETVDGTVVAKVRKEHTRYRRSGRRVRIADGHYNTWHVRIRCAYGEFQSPSMDYGRYSRLRVGATVPVEVGDGLLGYKTVRLKR